MAKTKTMDSTREKPDYLQLLMAKLSPEERQEVEEGIRSDLRDIQSTETI